MRTVAVAITVSRLLMGPPTQIHIPNKSHRITKENLILPRHVRKHVCHGGYPYRPTDD